MDTLFTTKLGQIICADSLQYLKTIESDTIDLVLTSPPYALIDTKSYNNPASAQYIEWFMPFATEFKRVIKPSGSIVINTGGAWNEGIPTRSLYQFKLLIAICENLQLSLCEEFFWWNPVRLTTTEYAGQRKYRVKDLVEQIWWLAKNIEPKANVNNVLFDYSENFKKILSEGLNKKLKTSFTAHSGVKITNTSYNDNGGKIPGNLLVVANTSSSNTYFSRCKEAGIPMHPARFPVEIPQFFISFLTDAGDTVLDPFSGSCTTGWIAEQLGRKWICIDKEPVWLQGGILRFQDNKIAKLAGLYD